MVPFFAAFLIAAFAADTTLPSYNTGTQAYVPMRVKDNNDTSFAPLVWAAPTFPGTFKVATSTGAAQANSPVLPAAASKVTYCAGFTVVGGGATAASAITCTLSD